MEMCNQGKVEEFVQALEESLPCPSSANARAKWKHFRNVLHNAVVSTCDKNKTERSDQL